MGFRTASATGALVTANSTGTGSEFNLLSVGPISAAADGAPIIILWAWSYVATATTLVVRALLRRGLGVAGTLLLQTADLTGTAGQGVRQSGVFIDTPTTSAPQIYSLNCGNVTGGAAQAFSELQLFAFAL